MTLVSILSDVVGVERERMKSQNANDAFDMIMKMGNRGDGPQSQHLERGMLYCQMLFA